MFCGVKPALIWAGVSCTGAAGAAGAAAGGAPGAAGAAACTSAALVIVAAASAEAMRSRVFMPNPPSEFIHWSVVGRADGSLWWLRSRGAKGYHDTPRIDAFAFHAFSATEPPPLLRSGMAK